MMFGLTKSSIAIAIGFILGTIFNRFVELKMRNFPGWGKRLVPGTPINQDDAVLMGIAVAIMLMSKFVVKVSWLFYVGFGFFLAIVTDEIMEVVLGESA